MPVIVEAFLVSIAMIIGFFAIFALIFLVALMLLPMEKSLSKVVWELSSPPRRTPPAQEQGPGFKGFSQKHR
ncbi:MAG: hypothetical protein WBI04_09265 [Trichlorobacter sp.]|jgi:uncharacterized membrane protein